MVRRIVLLLVVLVAVGCGAQTATSPTNGPLSLPTITSVAPTVLHVAAAPQTVTITGTNLQTVTQVVVLNPTGTARTFTGTAIMKLTTTSFEISLTLDELGRYQVAAVVGATESASTSFTVS